MVDDSSVGFFHQKQLNIFFIMQKKTCVESGRVATKAFVQTLGLILLAPVLKDITETCVNLKDSVSNKLLNVVRFLFLLVNKLATRLILLSLCLSL